MTIIEMLQDKNNLARISTGSRWMCGDGEGGWVVYERPRYAKKTSAVGQGALFALDERPRYAKKTKVVIETNDEEKAVAELLEEESE